jgi:UDP-GlcNAc:undecaprenyl-phosphate GlcNAc-1-phosphate transferase
MLALCLVLLVLAAALSLPLTGVAAAIGRRLNALDNAGVAGQVKAGVRRVPNTGGVGIFLAIALPMAAGAVAVALGLDERLVALFPGMAQSTNLHARTAEVCWLLAALAVMHVVGLIDDRRALGPVAKLVPMVGVAAGLALLTKSRLLTLLDEPAGGEWASYLVTIVWIVVVMNAFNFLDNMDGLSGGVAAICAGFFLVATIINGQWFIGAVLSLLIGALLGFLWHNYPWRRDGAAVFMGDGGSLVVGLLLAFLTVRTTYLHENLGGGWYGVFMPLVVLAIPLYDACSVTLIRLSQGRSPLVGDLQHFSHRLVSRGLSRRAAVNVIYGLTAITAIGGVSLGRLEAWQAVLVGVQTLLVVLVLVIFEWSSRNGRSGTAEPVQRDGP